MFENDFENDTDPLEFTSDRIWTVSDITARIKNIIESDPALYKISVRGEVTNLSASKAGHIYFGLKDKDSYLKCVAFRGSAMKLAVKPTEGREVVATGRVNVWEAGGSYQLIVDALQDVGLGELWLKFEETRKRLTAEGLFDEDKKAPLPRFPRMVGIVTSPDGAALRDMLRVFSDRAPYLRIILSPSLVQGATAPTSLIRAVNLLSMWHETEISNGNPGLDLMIIGRGGGSFEDLACFNDEALVRLVSELEIPVISAVGHEVDFTIIDFVADLRAATPTQAAQLATPDVADILSDVKGSLNDIRQSAVIKLDTYRTGYFNIMSRPVYTRPVDRINNFSQNLDAVTSRLTRAVEQRLRLLGHKLRSAMNRLETLDPSAILSRGYSLAFNVETGRLISRTAQVSKGDRVDLRVSDGTVRLKADGEGEVNR